MTDAPTKKPNAQLEGLTTAPQTFADGFAGISVRNGVAHINLTSERFHPGRNEMLPVVTGILIIPAQALLEFSAGLSRTAQELITKGAVPPPPSFH